ncbi:MAG: APC family permease [Gammaproteobacteria bacterium]|nr:APC family permease [Gammaproteobacteria bacterium]MDH3751094.1 APC family permease [Gammaproteobacteria bacterium]
MNETHQHKKVLGTRDMVLFSVSAILLLDTLAAGASIGVQSVFWWLFLGLVFFVPYALICSEMGTAYPEQGGIYAWVRDAFGGRWASRVTWAYWVNTAVWLPAIYVLFAGVFSQLFMPDMAFGMHIAVAVALSWISVVINVISLNIGKLVPNLGAIIKTVVFAAIIGGAFQYSQVHGVANSFSVENLTPEWGEGLKYISVIIYGMLGFELVSAGSDEMKNPQRDVPRAIFVSGLIIIVMYTLATIALLTAFPADEIDVVEGLVDSMYLFFGDTETGAVIAMTLGVGALYTFFSNGVTWALGCNRAAAEAALEGELPAVFGKEHAVHETPAGAAVLMGVVSTVMLVVYGIVATTNADLFWSLFAFSAVIFLLPYIGMVLAFGVMRRKDPDRHRPFRVAGGPIVANAISIVCALILAIAIFFFVYTPEAGMQWPVLSGAIIVLLIGEAVIRYAEWQRQNP